ncbi:MAG: hypothetical protein IKU32_06210 [Clostridia bacterium]|nr:hypothetical protein [Clostridia bacterium]
MKKLLVFILAITLAFSMSITAFAVESTEGDCIIKTWKTDSGETVTGIITRGSEVLVVVNMNPDSSDDARGIITHANTAGDTSEISALGEMSDYFYIQFVINDQVVSKYQIVLKGKVTNSSRAITNLGINYVSGTRCAQDWSVDGHTAYVAITHPALGTMDAVFVLGWDGVFYAF